MGASLPATDRSLGARPEAAPAYVAVALLTLLCAGVLPVWALAVHTPFRIVDDFAGSLGFVRSGVLSMFPFDFSLRNNPMRFRPTWDLGWLVAHGLFAADHRWHHAMRLLMRAAAFAALMGVALAEVERLARRRLTGSPRLFTIALGFSLFFYFPNNPEARLAPQELAVVLYLMGALFFVRWKSTELLCLLCFALAIWSKEPTVVPGGVLLVLIYLERACDGAGGWRAAARVLPHALIWLHAVVKITLMNLAGGYGRPPLRRDALLDMLHELPRQLLLSASAWWLPVLFAVGLTMYVLLGLARAPSGGGRRRALMLPAILLASLGTYLAQWTPAWRYAFPTVSLLILLTLIGYGLALVHAPHAQALRRRSLALAGLALAFAMTNYRDMTTQFSVQYVAANTEWAMFGAVERLMRERPRQSFTVVLSDEDAGVAGYFNHHLPTFSGRTARMRRVPKLDAVDMGEYLVTRRRLLSGFEEVLTIGVHPQPVVLAAATAISRAARLGGSGPPPPIDAGALVGEPGPPGQPWYVMRRIGRPGTDEAAVTQPVP